MQTFPLLLVAKKYSKRKNNTRRTKAENKCCVINQRLTHQSPVAQKLYLHFCGYHRNILCFTHRPDGKKWWRPEEKREAVVRSPLHVNNSKDWRKGSTVAMATERQIALVPPDCNNHKDFKSFYAAEDLLSGQLWISCYRTFLLLQWNAWIVHINLPNFCLML